VSGALLISVSAPELGIQSTEEDDKAREVLQQIRTEINDLIGLHADGYVGLQAASQRVEEYRQLAVLWRGTREEKARLKFVDLLIKSLDDKRKALDVREARTGISDARSGSATGRNGKGATEGGAAAGLLRNLQRFKDDLYLE